MAFNKTQEIVSATFAKLHEQKKNKVKFGHNENVKQFHIKLQKIHTLNINYTIKTERKKYKRTTHCQ